MRILVAEDDTGLRKHLVAALRAAGHEVDAAADGISAFELLSSHTHDAAVIDITMPGMDGVSLIRKSREGGCRASLLLSTARGELADKVAGLDAGADDYLVKPYSTEELLARLRASERRAKPENSNILRVADLVIDLLTRTTHRGETRIVLTNREFALLETLATASPRPVSKATLVERVWDHYFDPSSNVVNVYVNYLRKKIDLPGLTPLIHTRRGVGFSLSENGGDDS
ncbi:MAG: response regulator transcription factor [Gloeobacteraceae cyanobacterium ES-bin-144]|nr:response regulator transcription factor [Verrucomicrobiales bacterium]